ncbi:HAD-IIB family hydrolase [Brevibacillus parabrevis]|uniref:Hydrolase n=1 Tax=Brevibacillus parabrevis TaxID=54914 RepID=A0A4Y3PU37_BREPA|nr:HAD family hydrolase [Brevibacillus parabrevis]RNB92148.1 HAD family phosphatase [Brevibacillus parabrevis]GEB33921.1 hydrolase [Brevibacillus parabrevis]
MRFIFDLDGTICFKGQPISKSILDCLLELEQEGHTVGFASARPCRDMLPVLDERFANHLLIGANGAMTYHQGRLQSYTAIPGQLATEIIRILADHQAQFLIDDKWDYAHNCTEAHPVMRNIDCGRKASRIDFDQLDAVLKILILSADRTKELAARLKELDVTMHHHSAEDILDLTCRGVNKLAALEWFAPQDEPFICFGNDMNDLPLFEQAQHSVLIGEYEPLVPLATEKIAVDSQVESVIVSKIQELSVAYKPARTY